MSAITDQLHQDHINAVKLLALLEKEMNHLKEDQHPDMMLMSDIIHYMISYMDSVHHPKEEIVFETLEQKAQCPAELKTIYSDHVRIEELGEKLQDLIDQVVAGGITSKDTLSQSSESYIKALRDHMKLEEQAIFPLMDKYLVLEDWEKIEEKIEPADDPVFCKSLTDRYERLREALENTP